MSDAKQGRGRPSAYGKNNENVAQIKKDILDPASATPYYVQKLIAMGFLKIAITDEGQKFIDAN